MSELKTCKICSYTSAEVTIINELCSVHTCEVCGAEAYASGDKDIMRTTRGAVMISRRLIETDIATLDLIFGECQNQMAELDQIMSDLPPSTSEDSAEYKELDARFGAFAYIREEIDRITHERAKFDANGGTRERTF